MRPYYDDGTVTIYHGDCREILPSLRESVDMVFTSPPYNLGVSTGGSFPDGKSYGKWSGSSLAGGYGAYRDALPWPDYEAFQYEILRECWRLLSPAGAIFYNHKPRVQAGVMKSPLEFIPPEIAAHLRQIIIWRRAGGINAAPTHYCPFHEWIVLLARPEFRLRSKAASMVGDVWDVPQSPNTKHPAPFPVALPGRAIETAAPSVVLDPFMGSGTTLRAAKDRGVRAVGIELEERWCEYAVGRLAQGVLAL